MALIAQASLKDNDRLMLNPAPLVNLLGTSRQIWTAAGNSVVEVDRLESLIEPQFVLNSALQPQLITNAPVLKNVFSLVAAPVASPTITLPTAAITPAAATIGTSTQPADLSALTVLPCRRFAFLPDSAELTVESRRVLDLCVLPMLQQRAGSLLYIKGSAAWPGPQGTYKADQIRSISQARAQAVANYLVLKKIDPARLNTEGIMPPRDHWESSDPNIQASDRYVEMTLMTTGR